MSFLGGARNKEGIGLYLFLVGFCGFKIIYVQESNKSPLKPCGKSTADLESVMKPEIEGCTWAEILAPVHDMDGLNSSFQEKFCFI